MIIIANNLRKPFDEGAKIATSHLIENIRNYKNIHVIALNSSNVLQAVNEHFQINKFWLKKSFYKSIIRQRGDNILFIPSGAANLYGIIRAKILNAITGKNIYILSFMPRELTFPEKIALKTIPPKLIITASAGSAHQLANNEVKSTSIPLGVDNKKYKEFSADQKKLLRKEYGIDPEKTVLLHAGHIQGNRNLDWLIDVKKYRPNIEIMLIGSSYNAEDDKELYNRLTNSGIKVIKEYIANMAVIYNLADYYIFPVLKSDGAIETPLSVLEAMACNLPVITTRFGSLPDTFEADDDFYYADSSDEIIKILDNRVKSGCENREKVLPFTWDQIAKNIADIVEKDEGYLPVRH